ncbi:MAG: UDP-N-acetylmuramoyl-L-alanyl-D-glutamate--2,6-diaminopimelate ligase [Salinarimonadaceae bacterium]|nr:MAG: UDP-N-acetylmuramoyl-L-alanyl-D-glutamate--2,6-diaminopimelate ligase [Salinarimonadaceae bacterium]
MPFAATLGALLGATGHDDALVVAGLTADSRNTAPGFLFFAIAGSKADGARFIPDALARGAVAVVGEGERPTDLPEAIAWRRVPNARLALAQAAARLHPRQPETIVAVTGTAGKSSVADFFRQIAGALGARAASIGTLGVVTTDGAVYGSLTTPDPVALHETLDALAGVGIARVAMEASSHGLDQYRLDGVRLSAAAFTNLGRDHLDYHVTMEAYLEAKLRLFAELLPPGAPAIVNADGDYADQAARAIVAAGRALVSVGMKGEWINLAARRVEGGGQRLTLFHEGREYDVLMPLIGDFQAENALVAAGLAIATGSEPEQVFAALEGLKGVPGRLEAVSEARGALCVVDYAHKPEALAHALEALRPFTRGRLVCVFGCGGDRDPGKRPIMGRIAAERADLVVVTDDNPRNEEPATIRAAILAAAPGAREIGDRAQAIREAVSGLRDGDVLLVAGKGHETGQIVGDRILPFSDHEAVRAAVAELTA